MSRYTVPQDVEADDKLIGPFTFRQFIYLVIVAMACGIGWALSKITLPLALIVSPVVIFFSILALPLRKDQPMEAYLAAIVSFILKPHLRMWDPDGVESLIEITAPKITEPVRIKEISQTEAEKRLSYLAEIADTQGWAVRGATPQPKNTSMVSDVYFEAQQAEDILDIDNTIAHNFASKLDQSAAKHREDLARIVQGKPVIEPNTIQPSDAAKYFTTHIPRVETPKPSISTFHEQEVHDPYIPTIPTTTQTPRPVEKPASANTVSPDIINLANNADLSIETIAREANRIQKSNNNLDDGTEVVISLR